MLIAVDGVYSVGKSTMIARLAERLARELGDEVPISDWNSSELVGGLIPRWKREGRLGAHSIMFAEAADLAHRLENGLRDLLDTDRTVIADRYVLSGMARALIRGVDREIAQSVFSFAPRESMLVLVDCPPAETLRRRKALGKVLDGYHSGRDFRRTDDVEGDFVWYQDKMRSLYRDLAASRERVITVDTTRQAPDECVEVVVAALFSAARGSGGPPTSAGAAAYQNATTGGAGRSRLTRPGG